MDRRGPELLRQRLGTRGPQGQLGVGRLNGGPVIEEVVEELAYAGALTGLKLRAVDQKSQHE